MINYDIDKRNYLDNLADKFKGDDSQFIRFIVKSGSDRDVESLIYECEAKIEGRNTT